MPAASSRSRRAPREPPHIPLPKRCAARPRRAGSCRRSSSPRSARAGLGVEAGPPEARVLVGARALLAAHGVPVDAALDEKCRKLAEAGLSLAWVAEAGRCLGALAVADTPRSDARAKPWRACVPSVSPSAS